MVKNPDILRTVAAQGLASFVMGFAAETGNVLAYATQKLEDKKLDMIVANEVGRGLGFERDVNQVTVITKKGQIALELTHKTRLAGQIIAILAATLHNGAQ